MNTTGVNEMTSGKVERTTSSLSVMTSGYWASPWPAEDGGPTREQRTRSIQVGEPTVTSRLAVASTMVVRRDSGEWYLLCHTGGDDAVSWVEKFHPTTLDIERRSVDLPGGLTWPGGLAVHANGDIYVTFGRYVHRLTPDLDLVASLELPRNRPYNSLVILSDGTIITKDFGGARPGEPVAWEAPDCEVVALTPDLEIVATCTLTEGSVARLSATATSVVVVGVSAVHVVEWSGSQLHLRSSFEYRLEGEGYGWDAVLADGRAWFLNNGAGSSSFDGSLKDKGVARSPQCVVSVDLHTGGVTRFLVSEQEGSLVANPPAVDSRRQVVVGYDSAHGIVRGYSYAQNPPALLWERSQWHACHPLVVEDDGYVVLNDFNFAEQRDELVVVETMTGREVARAVTASPLQSVLFGAPGDANDLYLCSFTHLNRIAWT